nr:hypothetical protein [Clostridium sp. KNHs216]
MACATAVSFTDDGKRVLLIQRQSVLKLTTAGFTFCV